MIDAHRLASGQGKFAQTRPGHPDQIRVGFAQYDTDLLWVIVQELCESRGGRPGLSVLTSLLVSMDVKLY